MTRMIQIEQPVLAALSSAETDGQFLKLTGQLDRALYQKVDKVIRAAGGAWDKRQKAHVFTGDTAADALEDVLLTGTIDRQTPQQRLEAFYTPDTLADRVIALACLKHGAEVLEPSAGRGALASRAARAGCVVDCIDVDPLAIAALMGAQPPYRIAAQGDFLQLPARRVYDAVVMNPPFAKQADIQHVQHAARFVKPGGRLVAITSATVIFRTDRRTIEFRDWVEGCGRIEPLPEGSFKAAGTSVNTALVVVDF